MIRRRGANPHESSSSDDDNDDVFTTLSKKQKTKSDDIKSTNAKTPKHDGGLNQEALPIVLSTTSSMKRHHVAMSNSRKAQMEALIQELEAEKIHNNVGINQRSQGFVPEKRGSYVEPGDELRTTNLFVGNLAPNLTEDQITKCFSRFGDLHSVKIMWPRTLEEKTRNRVSGFICYRRRRDAENAMDSCDDADPFGNGRRLMVRWGKNVMKVPEDSILIGDAGTNPELPTESESSSTIEIVVPEYPQRERFISNVASSVAMDGPSTEQRLLEERKGDPDYSFLDSNTEADEKTRQENYFYRWRVYSFRQGDTRHSWRSEPFQMVSGGRTWLPPKRLHDRSRQAVDGNMQLNDEELEQFQNLIKNKLCASRKAICAAMAFCFEHSACSTQIGKILEDLLLDSHCSVETRISRLYLISDILFNSQQPGVKNAFRYRDMVEKMAPSMFTSFGKIDASMGRMTQQKLQTAVTAVISAWNSWSVFDGTFLDELTAKFEGRELVKLEEPEKIENLEEIEDEDDKVVEEKELVTFTARGDWTEVEESKDDPISLSEQDGTKIVKDAQSNSESEQQDDDVDDDDIDGQPLEEGDLDEEGLRRLQDIHQVTDDDTAVSKEEVEKTNDSGVSKKKEQLDIIEDDPVENKEKEQLDKNEGMSESDIDEISLREGEALENNAL
mmetsp:Transcript_13071/g.20312  ORF Transcript_13071/g.20312 Transcript_13071/m.20312 type:complete len:671 (-) Transcript_13071:54-2066(-)